MANGVPNGTRQMERTIMKQAKTPAGAAGMLRAILSFLHEDSGTFPAALRKRDQIRGSQPADTFRTAWDPLRTARRWDTPARDLVLRLRLEIRSVVALVQLHCGFTGVPVHHPPALYGRALRNLIGTLEK